MIESDDREPSDNFLLSLKALQISRGDRSIGDRAKEVRATAEREPSMDRFSDEEIADAWDDACKRRDLISVLVYGTELLARNRTKTPTPPCPPA
jgi:hypothetical protein